MPTTQLSVHLREIELQRVYKKMSLCSSSLLYSPYYFNENLELPHSATFDINLPLCDHAMSTITVQGLHLLVHVGLWLHLHPYVYANNYSSTEN